MSADLKKTHELRNRIICTMLILVIYMICRNLILFGIDTAAISADSYDAQTLIIAMLSGDRYRSTLMALGIMPGITAAIIVQFAMIFMGKENRKRFSEQRINRITAILLVIISVIYAVIRSGDLILRADLPVPAIFIRILDGAAMVFGACLIYQMGEFNKKHGIGGLTVLIFFNIADGLISTVNGYTLQDMLYPLILCVVLASVTAVMENFMIRIPVQRVSIHNEYADKDYLAFKLNPIGIMPVMFATAVFMLPQLILQGVVMIWPGNAALAEANENMLLTKPLGSVVYLVIVFSLTIVFTFVMLNPSDIAEQLQESGDSIVNIYAGKPTGRYIRRILFFLSVLSGFALSAGMGISLFLSLTGMIPAGLAMLPSSAMIFVGIACSLIQEIGSYCRFDSYRFFI